MSERYRVTRESLRRAVPFGAPGVGIAAGLLTALVVALLPRAWLEAAAFQLYLDLVIPSARAPLGLTAQLITAAIAGVIVGGFAWLAARLLGVTAMPVGLSDLLARLRGDTAADEEDAPPLRAADRHPDAPARRPFSASRDIPQDFSGTTIDARPLGHDEDEDELLLDLPLAEEAPAAAPVADERPAFAASSAPVDTEPAAAMPEERVPFGAAMDRPMAPADNADVAFDLPAPTLDDWESGRFDPVEPSLSEAASADPAPIDPFPVHDASAAASTDPVEASPAFASRDDAPAALSQPLWTARTAAVPPPLDLSAARLDDLIARLESGWSRRSFAGSSAPAPAGEDGRDGQPDPAAVDTAETVVDADPAFPHDPALAAALATLRKMNRVSA